MASTLYTLPSIPAVVRSKTNQTWLLVNVLDMKCSDLYANYRNIEIAVADAFAHPYTLNLYDYESELRYSTQTFRAWFTAQGTRSFTLKAEYPVLNTGSAKYLPLAFTEGGTYQLAKRGYHPSHVVALEDYDDVIVTHPKVTPKYLHERALWSVGGYFLPTTYHDYGLRIQGAGDIIRKATDLTAGCLNFEKLGKITQIPLTTQMVYKVDDTTSYYNRLIINTGKDLKNKTVGIVLGGYLHLLDGFVRVVGDQTIMISLRNLRLAERVLTSRKHLDLSFMECDDVEISAVVSKMRSDAAVLKYVTSPYSFVVIFDNPNMYQVETPIDRNAFQGNYLMSDNHELGLLVDQHGRNLEYWPHWEAGIWSLETRHSHLPFYAFMTTGWYSESRINDALVGDHRVDAIQPRMFNYQARI